MAFTDTQKAKLRMFLGYPDVFRQYNPRLESVFDVIGARPEVQTLVEDLITRIEAADAAITSALDYAGLKRAEDVEWYQAATKFSAPQDAARALGKMLVGRLSGMMGVPPWRDYFGTEGYPGDAFMSTGNQMTGGGMIPLG